MTSHYEGEEHHFWWSYAPEREILLLLLHVDTVWYTWDLTYEGMTQFSYEVKMLSGYNTKRKLWYEYYLLFFLQSTEKRVFLHESMDIIRHVYM